MLTRFWHHCLRTELVFGSCVENLVSVVFYIMFLAPMLGTELVFGSCVRNEVNKF